MENLAVILKTIGFFLPRNVFFCMPGYVTYYWILYQNICWSCLIYLLGNLNTCRWHAQYVRRLESSFVRSTPSKYDTTESLNVIALLAFSKGRITISNRLLSSAFFCKSETSKEVGPQSSPTIKTTVTFWELELYRLIKGNFSCPKIDKWEGIKIPHTTPFSSLW